MNTSESGRSARSWLIVRRATWRQLASDLAYILPGFIISLLSFIVLIALFSLGISTLIVWAGLPVLVACLATARWFAQINRASLRRWAREIPPAHYKARGKHTVAGMFRSLADPQLWKDFIHGTIVAFIYRTAAFCVAVAVLAAVLGGLTQWFWLRFLPADNTSLASLLGIDTFLGISPLAAESILGLVCGTVLLVLLPFITRLLAITDAAMTRSLLTNENSALRARSAELDARRGQVVAEGVQTLRRIERDLHDGPQQRLIRLQMDVESAKRRMLDDPAAAEKLMDGALEQSREALAELRALSRGIAPPILADRGLAAALQSLAVSAAVPVELFSNLDGATHLGVSAENAAYFVVSEALANVSKHSRATAAAVTVAASPAELTIEVQDNGFGGAHAGKGHGLAGLIDRLAGVDGSLELQSPDGGPTILRATIPFRASAGEPLA